MALDQPRVSQLHTVNDLRAEMQRIGADLSLLREPLAPYIVKLENISTKFARFIYQEMMLEGGMVILPARMDDRSTIPVDMLVIGTRIQLTHLVVRIHTQNIDELNLLADELDRTLANASVRHK